MEICDCPITFYLNRPEWQLEPTAQECEWQVYAYDDNYLIRLFWDTALCRWILTISCLNGRDYQIIWAGYNDGLQYPYDTTTPYANYTPYGDYCGNNYVTGANVVTYQN
jgi:hypothetical protein